MYKTKEKIKHINKFNTGGVCVLSKATFYV